SVHSMTSISSPLMKSIRPIAHPTGGPDSHRRKGNQYCRAIEVGMTDAESLHCPNFGAAVDPQAARCPDCRARLAMVSCPQCFALMFQGSGFCPKCGARSSRAAVEPSTSICPGCRGQLARVML